MLGVLVGMVVALEVGLVVVVEGLLVVEVG